MIKPKRCYSFSAINTYMTCPRQFEGQYVTKKFRFTGNEATRHGERIHKQLEDYLNGLDVVPEQAPTDALLDVLRNSDAKAEMEMAVTADWKPTGFWSDDARLRGKLDVTVITSNLVYAVDWKTGKKRDNSLQSKVYSALVAAHYPGKDIAIVFDYLEKGRQPAYRASGTERAYVEELMDTIDATEVWAPRPSPLCRWCVVTDCEYND